MLRHRCLVGSIAAILFYPVAAASIVKTYNLYDHAELTFITIEPSLPCAVTGKAVINDPGNGHPTLQSLAIDVNWNKTFVGPTVDTFTRVAGSSIAMSFSSHLRPASFQPGTGSINSSINWGTLTGWTQTGQFRCETHCPTTCVVQICQAIFGFEGLGAPPTITSASYNLDPWTFTGSGNNFTGPSTGKTFWFIDGFLGTVFLSGGIAQIPAVGIWGASVLAGLLLAGSLGAWRRRSSG